MGKRIVGEARNAFIGASEVPILFGLGYGEMTPYQLWRIKVGIDPPTDDSPRMRTGRLFEEAIVRAWAEESDVPVHSMGAYQESHTLGSLLATPDALTDLDVPVEAKYVGFFMRNQWTDREPPLRVKIQSWVQQIVLQSDTSIVVAKIEGDDEIKSYVMDRAPAKWEDAIYERTEEFWELVKEQRPPNVVSLVDCSLRWDDADPEASAVLPQELVSGYLEAKLAGVEAKKALDEAAVSIKAIMGNATKGVLPDGTLAFTWRANKNGTRQFRGVIDDF